jgi:Flp pilus assembly protein TadG
MSNECFRNHSQLLYSLGSNCHHLAKRFRRGRRGAIAVITALTFIALAVCAGIAIDFSRGSRQRSALNSAIDAAALAVGVSTKTDQGEIEQLAIDYVNANYNSQKYPGTLLDLDVVVTDDIVQITAQQQMQTTFMKIVNIDSMNLTAHTEVRRSVATVEVVMVLDNTGSMNQDGKIGSLKIAAVDLADILFGDNAVSENVKVGVVPFSASVNVGPQYTDDTWLDHTGLNPISHLNFTDATKHNRWAWDQLSNKDWNGCVEQRKVANGIDFDIDDTTPTTSQPTTLFPIYFAPDEPTNANQASSKTGWGSGFSNSYIADWRSNESVSTDTKSSTTLDIRQRRDQKYIGTSASGDGPGYNCGIAPLTPLTGTKQTIVDAIDDMIADGNTNIASGVGWGLRVLSPTAPFTEGTAYDDEDWRKVMIVMTDGESVWGARNTMNLSGYGGYGYISQSLTRLNMNSVNNSRAVYDARTAKACDVVKNVTGDPDKPVVIYSITFGSIDNTAKDLMKNCATDPEKYFHAPDGETIRTVFKQIAREISDVYLSK